MVIAIAGMEIGAGKDFATRGRERTVIPMPDLIQRLKDAYIANPASALKMLPKLFQAADDGRVVELPCKVGDKVFVWSKTIPTHEAEEFDEDGNGPDFVEAKIISIRKNSKGWFVKFSVYLHWQDTVHDPECGDYDEFVLKSRYFTFPAGSIGRTVFLTREAAEAALKEREI